jgi:hypothetical protein
MLHVITHGTDTDQMKQLRESAAISGLSIRFITPPQWEGYYDKIRYVQEMIQYIPDDDIICFIDCYDVLSLAPAVEIEDKFLSFGCDIVIGAEINCWPEFYEARYPPHPDPSSRYRFINSGGYVGYRRTVSAILSWRPPAEVQEHCKIGSDQGYFMEYYFSHHAEPAHIRLDTRQHIFQNMFKADWGHFEVWNGRVYNRERRESPCFLHFNGKSFMRDGRNLMPAIVETLRHSRAHPDLKNNLS